MSSIYSVMFSLSRCCENPRNLADAAADEMAPISCLHGLHVLQVSVEYHVSRPLQAQVEFGSFVLLSPVRVYIRVV